MEKNRCYIVPMYLHYAPMHLCTISPVRIWFINELSAGPGVELDHYYHYFHFLSCHLFHFFHLSLFFMQQRHNMPGLFTLQLSRIGHESLLCSVVLSGLFILFLSMSCLCLVSLSCHSTGIAYKRERMTRVTEQLTPLSRV